MMSQITPPRRRPHRHRQVALVLLIALIIFGAALGGWLYYDYRQNTALAEPLPALQIVVRYEGASSHDMEDTVAVVLEDAIVDLPGVQHVLTHSIAGETVLTIYLQLNANPDDAIQTVLNAVAEVQPKLPAGVEGPSVTKSPRHLEPVIWLAVYSPDAKCDGIYLSKFVEETFGRAVARTPGVGGVDVIGGASPGPCLNLDFDQLARNNLSPGDVYRVLREQKIDLKDQSAKFELENTILRGEKEGPIVRLRDVGSVEWAAYSDGFCMYDGHPAVALGGRPGKDVSAKDFPGTLFKGLDSVKSKLPEGIDYVAACDLSQIVIDAPTSFNKNRPRAFSNDAAEFVILDVQLPDAASSQRTQDTVSQIDAILLQTPGVAHVLAYGVESDGLSNRARLFVQLEPAATRHRRYTEVCQAIREGMRREIRGAVVRLSDPSGGSLPPMHRQAVTLMIQGPSPDEREKFADKLLATINSLPGIEDGHVHSRAHVPELVVQPDHEKLKTLGISLDRFNDEVDTFMGKNGRGRIGGRSGLRLSTREIRPFDERHNLHHLWFANDQGQMVPLSAVATIRDADSAQSLERYNRQPTTLLTANLAPGTDVEAVRMYCRQAVANTLPQPSPDREEYRALLWSEDPAAPPEILMGR